MIPLYVLQAPRRLHLVRRLDVERRPDVDYSLGWTSDLIDLFVDDVPAGYAMTSYIPNDRFAAYYPHGIWSWLRLVQGKHLLPESPEHPDARAALIAHHLSPPLPRDGQNPIDVMLDYLLDRYAGSWSAFCAFNVERPKFSYVRVYASDDAQSKTWVDGQAFRIPRPCIGPRLYPSFAGIGLGALLYRETARWLAASGRRLHASCNQDPSATAAWTRLQQHLPIALSLEHRPEIVPPVEDTDGIEPNPDPDAQMRPTQIAPPMWILDGASIPVWMPAWATQLDLTDVDGVRTQIL